MRIGGLQKLSLIDFPGQLAAVIFTQGCNFRCPYCHNRDLVLPESFNEVLPQAYVMNFLKKRKEYLQGVVISGGEPTLQEDLIDFIQKVKSLGYLVKLDTNGSNPETIKEIIRWRLVNYMAMDIKTSFEKYPQAIGVAYPVDLIKESIALIKASGIPHEFRTTVVRPFCAVDDIKNIAISLKGNSPYRLAAFHESDKILNPRIQGIDQFSAKEIESLQLAINV